MGETVLMMIGLNWFTILERSIQILDKHLQLMVSLVRK